VDRYGGHGHHPWRNLHALDGPLVIFGPLADPENQKLKDLNVREISLLAPILLLIVVMGVYPTPFLERMKPAIELSLKRILATPAAPFAVNRRPGGESQKNGR
jgi:NADH-quinone oxidoreductase subunit M